MVEVLRHIGALTEGRLTSAGSTAVAVDIATGLSACWAPSLAPWLGVLRLVAMASFATVLFREVAARYRDRPVDVLAKVAAVTLGLVAVYVGCRTVIVVQACRL